MTTIDKGRVQITDDDATAARKNVRRFWSKTSAVGDCIIWQAGKDADGYGRFATGFHGRQKHHRAHRWIYEQALGPIGDLLLLHSCDTPACVAVHHLTVGTQLQNVRDSIAKGRHSTARITDAQRLEILDRADRHQTLRTISEEMGIGSGAAQRIIFRARGSRR